MKATMDKTTGSDPQQYLTFVLGGELFALGILAVKEIIEHAEVTEVPLLPPAVRGVINLRGAAVPVLDLQARFGRPSSPITRKSCIVIIELQRPGGEGSQVLGAMVDAVNAVVDIAAADIEPPPSFGTRLRGDFVQGMAKLPTGRFVILLDAARVLSIDGLEEASAEATQAVAA